MSGGRIDRLLLSLIVCLAPAILRGQGLDSSGGLPPQRDLIDLSKELFHIHKGPLRVDGRPVYFSVLPTGSPAGNANLFITSTTAAFYAGNRANTFLSTVTFAPYITINNRIGFSLKSNLWSNGNAWDILGDSRFLHYPQYTWGLGGNISEDKRMLIDYKYIRLYHTFLRQVKPFLFAGFGVLIDDHFDMDTKGDSNALAVFTRYNYGTGTSENSLSAGLSLNLLYDGRKNSIDPFPGFYGNLVYRVNPSFLGSSFGWHSVYADVRKYIPFSRQGQNMLAFWGFYWTALNDHTPYLDLPSVGWDPYQQRSGRGFDQNRYRGKGLLYGEAEYRRDITVDGLFGFVLFANLNSVKEPVTYNFAYFHPAAGGGLRIKLNKHSHTNIALDYGVSSDYSAFYLNLGETF
jgi:hypothetical protein